VVDEVRMSHPDRTLEETHDGDGDSEWDSDRLAQVVTNLLGNALAYSPPGSPVTVRTRGEDGWVTLEVHNTGDPIPRERLPLLFEPFERGTDSGSGSRSIGLGLFIVDRVVHAHGGTVEVRSTVGDGTTFTVRLPRSPASRQHGDQGLGFHASH
jgi:signal transduction histidine kinase